MDTFMTETFLTPDQIAELLVIPVSRVHYWLRQGRLSGVKVGKSWRVPKSALHRFISGVAVEQPE